MLEAMMRSAAAFDILTGDAIKIDLSRNSSSTYANPTETPFNSLKTMNEFMQTMNTSFTTI